MSVFYYLPSETPAHCLFIHTLELLTHGSSTMIYDIDEKKAPMTLIKAYLEQEGMTYTNKSPKEMRIMVCRRKIRKKHSAIVAVQPLRGVTAAKSLGQFKTVIDGMMKNQYGLKSWQCFNAKLLFIEPEVTILRHNDTCRGVIKNGHCSTCGEKTDGETNFYVSFILCDLEDTNNMFNLIGYKAAGEAIFGDGTTAESVAKKDAEAVADVLEEWSEVPINVHAIVEYDIAKGKVRVSPYNMVRMPIDYLAEY